jgi:hypothetical protein
VRWFDSGRGHSGVVRVFVGGELEQELRVYRRRYNSHSHNRPLQLASPTVGPRCTAPTTHRSLHRRDLLGGLIGAVLT